MSSPHVLSQMKMNKKLTKQYKQIIQTTKADEIEEFELVDTWEDATNYWVFYRVSDFQIQTDKRETKKETLRFLPRTRARRAKK